MPADRRQRATCEARRAGQRALTAPPNPTATPQTTPAALLGAGADSRPRLPPDAMPQPGRRCCRPATQPRTDEYGWRGRGGAPAWLFMSFPVRLLPQLVACTTPPCACLCPRFAQHALPPSFSTNLAPTNEFSAALPQHAGASRLGRPFICPRTSLPWLFGASFFCTLPELYACRAR
jgi:hypothetical protein